MTVHHRWLQSEQTCMQPSHLCCAALCCAAVWCGVGGCRSILLCAEAPLLRSVIQDARMLTSAQQHGMVHLQTHKAQASETADAGAEARLRWD